MKNLHTFLFICLLAAVAYLGYQNVTLQEKINGITTDIAILKDGHNQAVLNTQNIATIAKILNPNIDSTLQQPAAVADPSIPLEPTQPAVQNAPENTNQ